MDISGVGAFEVVEEAVRELSIQHEEEIKSIRHVSPCFNVTLDGS